MGKPYYEVLKEINELGIRIAYRTVHGGYRPLHWHDELEILFPLNGDADITVEGKTYKLNTRHILVIDSGKIHSTYSYTKTHMFVCIQISKRIMQKYMPDIKFYQIRCIPEEISEDQFEHYNELCQMAISLTRLYFEDSPTSKLESEGIVLQMLARLLKYFSVRISTEHNSSGLLHMERMHEIIDYVDAHYMEQISLQDVADHFGLGKEYFCRFFKKHMGTSFLQYLNDVRATHIYQELQNTDTPISVITEENGFTNQKLFNKTFKNLYGCTPSSIRKKS